MELVKGVQTMSGTDFRPTVYFDMDGTLREYGEDCKPITRHIERMRFHKHCGHRIIVWSRGGKSWAEKACRELGIHNLVDHFDAKPLCLYDDQDMHEWVDNLFLKEGDK